LAGDLQWDDIDQTGVYRDSQSSFIWASDAYRVPWTHNQLRIREINKHSPLDGGRETHKLGAEKADEDEEAVLEVKSVIIMKVLL